MTKQVLPRVLIRPRPRDPLLIPVVQNRHPAQGQQQGMRQEHPPIHLVITDVVMPGLSGPELIQKLLAARPGVKVLYLSGYAPEAFSVPLATDAHKAFLQKPFTLQTLSRKVREVLGPPTK